MSVFSGLSLIIGLCGLCILTAKSYLVNCIEIIIETNARLLLLLPSVIQFIVTINW